jgi:diaminopimelate epimerase
MRFTKMHGIGNDYVYVDGFREMVTDPAGLARRIADRHFGVGGDGLILILPSEAGDVRMRMFNADGSEAQMCGNGVRCVAKYAHDHGLSDANPLRVETAAGVREIDLTLDPDDKVAEATVDMGEPVLTAEQIPLDVSAGPAALAEQVAGDPRRRAVDVPIDVAGASYRMTCVSMGNPHAVIFVEDPAAVPLDHHGSGIEMAAVFPERANVHFVRVDSPAEMTMRTWERGSGVTLACGTGAAAVCVAGVLTGRTGREVLIHLPGGDLRLHWREADNRVRMTGPAEEVFAGDWPE